MSKLFVTTGTSYTKHKEGDVWTENGKTWTIRNGIKRTVSKMDEARKQVFTPLACPSCGGSMKHHLDEKMWTIHKTCFQCVINMEHEIIKRGEWAEYEKQKITANAEAFCIDMESALQEYVQESVSKSHTSENGVIEKWKDADKGFIQNIVDDEVSQLKTIIEDYKGEIKEDSKRD